MKTSLDNRWYRKETDKEVRDKVKTAVINSITSDRTLQRLMTILDDEIISLERIGLDLDAYDSPSWSHKQAHINGQMQALYSIRKLLTHE